MVKRQSGQQDQTNPIHYEPSANTGLAWWMSYSMSKLITPYSLIFSVLRITLLPKVILVQMFLYRAMILD